jgi:uncharacterized protein YkwD
MTACGGSSPPGSRPTVDAPAGELAPPRFASVLAAHNRHRAAHCVGQLTWSTQLAHVAQAWADRLAGNGCAFGHSGAPYGENLAAGTEGALSGEAAVDMWYREMNEYDFAAGGFSMQTGHFTQIVWASTRSVGCGSSSCNGMRIWVCNYDPAGNVEGQYRQQVPQRCQ